MADQPTFDPASVRVYNLPATERSQYLTALQRYGTGNQWDHLEIDWSGQRRDAWTPHAIERLRTVGVWQVANAAQANTRSEERRVGKECSSRWPQVPEDVTDVAMDGNGSG